MGAITKVAPYWQTATVSRVTRESPTATTLILSVPSKVEYYAGQHLELRLRSESGYEAVRDYSIASAPSSGNELAVTIQMIPGGEVSEYVHDQLRPGDKLEINAPLGYHFIWTDDITSPVTLIAGGSGLVPLMSMWREAHLRGMAQQMNLLYSVRGYEDVLYKPELLVKTTPGAGIFMTMVESQPDGWTGYRRRIDASMIGEVCGPINSKRRFFICGPTQMVEAVSSLLVELGYDAALIKTERFGPTGSVLQKPSPPADARA